MFEQYIRSKIFKILKQMDLSGLRTSTKSLKKLRFYFSQIRALLFSKVV